MGDIPKRERRTKLSFSGAWETLDTHRFADKSARSWASRSEKILLLIPNRVVGQSMANPATKIASSHHRLLILEGQHPWYQLLVCRSLVLLKLLESSRLSLLTL